MFICSLLGSIAHMGTSKLHFRGCRKPRNLLFFFAFLSITTTLYYIHDKKVIDMC
nr:MAG TPA: hypothetical protein [Caudoviricetes sp.]